MRLPFSWGELSEGNLTNRTILTLILTLFTTVVVEGRDDVKKNPSHERSSSSRAGFPPRRVRRIVRQAWKRPGVFLCE